MTTQVIRRGFTNTVSFGSVRALILLLGLLALIGMIYLGQSSQATVTGQHVQNLQEQLDRLNRENAQYQYDIAVLTTPSKIAERARALGLRPATSAQMVFLTVKNYPISVAKITHTPIDQSITASSSDSGVAVLWQEFLVRLGLSSSARTVEATTNP
jgi:cell division protein FtsL